MTDARKVADEFELVGVVAKNSIDYVSTLFHCYKNKQVVVLLRDASDERVDMLGIETVITPGDDTGWYTKQHDFDNPDELAQIAFTSGTEGSPKGVMLTHQALADVTQRLNSVMEVDSSIREYVGIPANFSFGLGRFRAVASAGGKAYLPVNGFNPVEIRNMLADGDINAVSAVPSLWRVLLKNKSIFGDEAKRLKWIEIGSQYMSRDEKVELKRLFPSAIIVQHYGLTEASRTSFLKVHATKEDDLESVGAAYGDTEVRISDNGRIAIRGPHVAKQLIKNGQVVSNVDEQGWFETSDLGKVESDYLYYQGRADDQINCNGIKLQPDSIERDIREKANIKDGIAVAAIPDELTGQAVMLGVLKSSGIDIVTLGQVAEEVLEKYGVSSQRSLKLVLLDEFPLTGTNKVKRKALTQLYSPGVEVALSQKSREFVEPRNDLEIGLARVWQRLLKIDRVGIDDNFFELGGDSLLVIMAIHEMSLTSGVEVDAGMLFSHPTIRALSEAIEDNTDSKPIATVIPLQEHGNGVPVFCLCGISLYQDLANSLGVEQPVYGVYVPYEGALIGGSSAQSDFSAQKLAELYCEAILRHQSEGPYQLAGISFGGLIAVETAKILKQKGKDVSLVVLLDTILPHGVTRSLTGAVKHNLKQALEHIASSMKRNGKMDKSDIDKARKKAFNRVMRLHKHGSDGYQGKVLLIKAEDQSSWGKGVRFSEDYGWSDVLSSTPEIFQIPGAHLEIIQPPHCLTVGNLLKPHLNTAIS